MIPKLVKRGRHSLTSGKIPVGRTERESFPRSGTLFPTMDTEQQARLELQRALARERRRRRRVDQAVRAREAGVACQRRQANPNIMKKIAKHKENTGNSLLRTSPASTLSGTAFFIGS